MEGVENQVGHYCWSRGSRVCVKDLRLDYDDGVGEPAHV